MRYVAIVLALTIAALQVCSIADARRGGGGRGGGGRGGGGMRGGSMSRGSMPSRGASNGGFNLGSDFQRGSGPMQRPGVAQRPAGGNLGNGNLGNGKFATVQPPIANRPGNGGNRPGNGGNRPGNGGDRPSRPGNGGDRPGKGGGSIPNPIQPGGCCYYWNGGAAWYPAPYYWGGGFWGPYAFGVTAVLYGEIEDEENDVTYNSYEVQPNTHGASFLTAYQLTQVACGPPGLVVVYGPEQSVVCANPNQYVGEGSYQLDTATLSLVSLGPPASPTPAPQPTTPSGALLVTPAPAPTR